jgi:hypothetical protein
MLEVSSESPRICDSALQSLFTTGSVSIARSIRCLISAITSTNAPHIFNPANLRR